MYICKKCGEYTKYPNDSGCYFCGGEMVEATKCKSCGEWSANGICDYCLREEMTLENVVEWSRKASLGYSVELPDFFEIYTQEEIKEILVKHILSTEDKGQKAVKEYCNKDLDGFRDFIEITIK